MESNTNYLTLSMKDTIKRIALFNSGLSITDIANQLNMTEGALSIWYCKRGMRRRKRRVDRGKPRKKEDVYNFVPDMPQHERLKMRHFLSILHNTYERKEKNDHPDVMGFMEEYVKLYGDGRNTYSLAEYI